MLYLVTILYALSFFCFWLAIVLSLDKRNKRNADRKLYLALGDYYVVRRNPRGYTTFPLLASVTFYAGLVLLVVTVCTKFHVNVADVVSLFRSLVLFPF